jgi:hypothetical protein
VLGVEYAITVLTRYAPVSVLYCWAEAHAPAVRAAQASCDKECEMARSRISGVRLGQCRSI